MYKLKSESVKSKFSFVLAFKKMLRNPRYSSIATNNSRDAGRRSDVSHETVCR